MIPAITMLKSGLNGPLNGLMSLLKDEDGSNIKFKLTEKGKQCCSLSYMYDPFSKFIPILMEMDKYIFDPNSTSIQNDLAEG